MRWLVVGSAGMLGQDLMTVLGSRGHAVNGVDRADVDITSSGQTKHLADGYDVVVNAAAYTAVDKAESDEAAAFAVNAVGAANLARAAAQSGARMVQISTDYVFDGTRDEPYAESAAIAPRSVYGRTKAAGEWAVRAEQPDHLVVRTAWLYGAHGACFPKTIARIAAQAGAVSVVDDQFGQPTWTVDLAELVERLVVARAPAGTYHGTSSGRTSWYDFARAVVGAAGMDPSIVSPTGSSAVQRPAPRPAFSVLGHDALTQVGVRPIGEWSTRFDVASAGVLGRS